MAACAALWRSDVTFFNKLETVFDLALLAAWVYPVEIEDLIDRTENFLRMTVAIETPAHAHWLFMRDDFHLVHLAMTLHTGDTTSDVSLVAEVDVVRYFVNTLPRDWLASGVAFADRSEQITVRLDHAVTLHTRVRSRDVCDVGLVDLIVTVTAIEPELVHVETVVVRDRLSWLVANSDVIRRHIICDACEERSHEDEDKNNDLQW